MITTLPSENRVTDLTPTRLSVYLQCPYRHYLKYVRHTREPSVVTPAVAAGGALHTTLYQAFRYRRAYRRDPAMELLQQWMSHALAGQWKGDWGEEPPANELVPQAAWVLDQVPADARTIGIEQALDYAPRAPYRFRARLDLLVQHAGGEVESLDSKTGAPHRCDWIAEAIHHAVIASNRQRLGIGAAPIRQTFLYTRDRTASSTVVTHDAYRARWRALTELAERACATEEPEPTPGPPCRWCGYARTAHCQAWRNVLPSFSSSPTHLPADYTPPAE